MTREEIILASAMSDARFDGRSWEALSKGDKKRYLDRAEYTYNYVQSLTDWAAKAVSQRRIKS